MPSATLKAVIFDIGGVVVRSPLLAIEQYEKEYGLPRNYINIAIARGGHHGAWQRFERGEMYLFPFYEAFGQDLSNVSRNNDFYRHYCEARNIDCPILPTHLQIDGRELLGRMMRESNLYDEHVTFAIERIRGAVLRRAFGHPVSTANKWRVIALTNNYSKSATMITGVDETSAPPRDRYPDFTLEKELEFLGWSEGATPPKMRAMFDDFCDSSSLGMRKPEKRFYLLACERNNVQPQECVFLDDLGMNLKVARQLGMETIHVPIGGSLKAIQELEKKLGITLTVNKSLRQTKL